MLEDEKSLNTNVSHFKKGVQKALCHHGRSEAETRNPLIINVRFSGDCGSSLRCARNDTALLLLHHFRLLHPRFSLYRENINTFGQMRNINGFIGMFEHSERTSCQ